MGNLLDLANRLDRIGPQVEEAVNERKKDVALALVSELVWVTPVDTSKALSNWQVDTEGFLLDSIDAHFPGEKGSTQRASALEAIAAAKRELEHARPGKALLIFNNVPYIRRLNEGYSAQAPAGFVEKAIVVARRVAAKKPLKLK